MFNKIQRYVRYLTLPSKQANLRTERLIARRKVAASHGSSQGFRIFKAHSIGYCSQISCWNAARSPRVDPSPSVSVGLTREHLPSSRRSPQQQVIFGTPYAVIFNGTLQGLLEVVQSPSPAGPCPPADLQVLSCFLDILLGKDSLLYLVASRGHDVGTRLSIYPPHL